jgi:1-acyl-sn-glycerol-3-phosphate acyltransferase
VNHVLGGLLQTLHDDNMSNRTQLSCGWRLRVAPHALAFPPDLCYSEPRVPQSRPPPIRTTLLSINDALQPMNMRLSASGSVSAGNWMLQFEDGSSAAFRDNMVLRSRGPEDAVRGRAVLRAYAGTAGVAALDAGGDGAAGSLVAAAGVGAAARAAGLRPVPQARVAGAVGAGAATWAGGIPVAAVTRPAAAAAAAHPPGFQPGGSVAPVARTGSSGGGGAAAALAAAAFAAGLHEDDLDDEEACVVCMAARRDTVLVPCGHVVLCGDCCDEVMRDKNMCPMCREGIDKAIRME